MSTGYDPSGVKRLEAATAELDACSKLVDAAQKAGRSLTESEKGRIDAAIAEKAEADDNRRLAGDLQKMIGGVSTNGGGSAGSFSKSLLEGSMAPSNPHDPMPREVIGMNLLSTALGIKAPTINDSAELWQTDAGALTAIGFDSRYMFRTLPVVQAEAGETSVDDFRVSARSVSGTVQRDLDAVTDKATLSNTFDRVLTEMRQFAVVIDSIPNALLDVSRPNGAIRSILDGEGRQQVENAIDAAAFTAVANAAGSGGAGADLVAKIRNGIGDLRDAGYDPDVLVVDTSTAAELDLFEKSTGAGYQFAVRSSNDSDPLFGLRVVESKAASGSDPLLYDSRRVGVQYLGSIAAMADPFAGKTGDNFVTNRTDLRFEATALTVVRDAAAAILLDES